MTWSRDIRIRLSGEEDTIIKDWGGKLPVALIYPNYYYIGMSNLGAQAIYRFINNRTDAVCERVFWSEGDTAPLAMESQRPLTDFAILAFSVNYELDYFNVVRILKAAGIPLNAKDRDEGYPLVIAGGPCITANPMPLAPFFDCLCIGEAEAILPLLFPVMQEGASENRGELLKKLSELPGIYVPQAQTGRSVVRQWVENLDAFPVVSTVLTRDTELGDMYLIEVQRGCKWGCRFCMVSNAFKPVRFQKLDIIIEQAKIGLKYRKRLGLVGPSVTDHPQIEELITGLRKIGAEISVSSLRIKPLLPVVLGEVIGGGTNTVALAPEAGSQRLRNAVRKGITEEDILLAVEKVSAQGIKQLKLYFMIGLPTETDEDIEEMAKLVTKCKNIFDKKQSWSRITLTVAAFIPKAGTPFQREKMESQDVLKHRLALLKSKLPGKGISVKNESLEWSEVQAVLSRGDEKLSEALALMEKTSLAEWHRAVKKAGLDADYYAHRIWDEKQELPWRVIE